MKLKLQRYFSRVHPSVGSRANRFSIICVLCFLFSTVRFVVYTFLICSFSAAMKRVVICAGKCCQRRSATIDGDGGAGITAGNASVAADDASVINSIAGAVSIAAGLGQSAGVAVSIGLSLAFNEISNNVQGSGTKAELTTTPLRPDPAPRSRRPKPVRRSVAHSARDSASTRADAHPSASASSANALRSAGPSRRLCSDGQANKQSRTSVAPIRLEREAMSLRRSPPPRAGPSSVRCPGSREVSLPRPEPPRARVL